MASRILQVGIDEAGYAPRLGPLVVTGVRLERPGAAPDLYEALAPVVSRSPGPRGARGGTLHVADSKKVHDPSKGIARLERGVLPFFRIALEDPPGRARASTDLSLASGLSSQPPDLSGLDWYAGEALGLPLAADAADVADSTAALAEHLRGAGISGLRIISKVVTARELNREVSAVPNKAELLVTVVARLMASLLEPLTGPGGAGARPTAPPGEAVVLVDRLGGRADYRGLLERAFPGVGAWELSRGARESSYSLEGPAGGWRCSVTFACGAESACMTVALASMTSKYVRELLMNRLNRWFASRVPGLRPTAGYPLDAARFLRDTAEFRARRRIPDADLVRSR